MKPLTNAFVNSPAWKLRPILMLEYQPLIWTWLSESIAKSAIRSPGGIALPNEIWGFIQDHVQNTPSMFTLVRCQEKVRSEIGTGADAADTVVHVTFRKVMIKSHNGDYFKCLSWAYPVSNIEAVMIDPTTNLGLSLADANITIKSTGPVFEMMVKSGGPERDRYPRLCSTLTAADLISRVNNGCCHVCRGVRFICLDCNRDHYKKYEVTAILPIDDIYIACPLCMNHPMFHEFFGVGRLSTANTNMVTEDYDQVRAIYRKVMEALGYCATVPEDLECGSERHGRAAPVVKTRNRRVRLSSSPLSSPSP